MQIEVAEMIAEPIAFGGQPIEVGSMDDRIPIQPKLSIADRRL
jgi:hypothetical protein